MRRHIDHSFQSWNNFNHNIDNWSKKLICPAAADNSSRVELQRLLDASFSSSTSASASATDTFLHISPVLPLADHSPVVVPALHAAVSILNRMSDWLTTGSSSAAPNMFANDNERFSVTTILSKAKSCVEHLHADFAPSAGSSSWHDYFRVSKALGMTPLSFLLFPDGGHLTYVASDMEISAKYILSLAAKRADYAKRDRASGKAAYAGGAQYISYRKSKVATRTLQIQPGSFVLFRQDVAHQDMAYLNANIRYFVFFDLKGVTRLSDSTTPVHLQESRKVSVKKMADAHAYIPPPKKRQNIKKDER